MATGDYKPDPYRGYNFKVEIDGISGPGDFASQIDNPQIRVLGQAPLPAPQIVSGEKLVTGVEDSQYVEVEGVVRSAAETQGRLVLHVASGTALFPAPATPPGASGPASCPSRPRPRRAVVPRGA